MNWYVLLATVAFLICLGNCLFHIVRLVKLGKPSDFAKPSGSIPAGLKYSFTTGMSPKKKESAFLYLPTYLAGILFHIGAFSTIALFLLVLFVTPVPGNILWSLAAVLPALGAVSGIAILLKRASKPLLRKLSNPDDYISNILVSLFQLSAATGILFPDMLVLFYFISILLWLYFPLGKLKHAVYFFAARYHLGLFFGSRGVWPVR